VERFYCLRERRAEEGGQSETARLPDVYGYAPVSRAVFDVTSGRLEGYSHPKNALGPTGR